MKKCLIIINRTSGGSRKIAFDQVEKCLGKEYEFTRFILPDDGEIKTEGYDTFAVCGGDGTLCSVLNKVYLLPVDVFYFPSGTLNDKAKASRYAHTKTECPSCSDTLPQEKKIVLGNFKKDSGSAKIFTYVLAAGSFTPIGYTSSIRAKQKHGTLAYISHIVKEYRPHRLNANIVCELASSEDGNTSSKSAKSTDNEFYKAKNKDKTANCANTDKIAYSGEYTLIMFLKSPRCFGFNCNKGFDSESASGHLIAIRSPKHNGILGCIEMFFPFFRVFFMGLKKERDGRIIYRKINSARVETKDDFIYCKDGEKEPLESGCTQITFKKSVCNFHIIEKY